MRACVRLCAVTDARAGAQGVDYWALGILVFEMLCGFSPYSDPTGNCDQMVICRNIVKVRSLARSLAGVRRYARSRAEQGKLEFPAELKDARARDLITKLLTPDPAKRLGCLREGAIGIRDHPWFEGFDWAKLHAKTMRAPWCVRASRARCLALLTLAALPRAARAQGAGPARSVRHVQL